MDQRTTHLHPKTLKFEALDLYILVTYMLLTYYFYSMWNFLFTFTKLRKNKIKIPLIFLLKIVANMIDYLIFTPITYIISVLIVQTTNSCFSSHLFFVTNSITIEILELWKLIYGENTPISPIIITDSVEYQGW